MRKNKEVSILTGVFGSSVGAGADMFWTKTSTLFCKVASGSSLGEMFAYFFPGRIRSRVLFCSVHPRRSSQRCLLWQKVKLPGFDQRVHFWNLSCALATNIRVMTWSRAPPLLCCKWFFFLYKYYFCFVNCSNIWNLNMLAVAQTNALLTLELGKCVIVAHTRAQNHKHICYSEWMNSRMRSFEAFSLFKRTMFSFIFGMTDIYTYCHLNLASHVSLSHLISALQCFPHPAPIVDFSRDPFFSNLLPADANPYRSVVHYASAWNACKPFERRLLLSHRPSAGIMGCDVGAPHLGVASAV